MANGTSVECQTDRSQFPTHGGIGYVLLNGLAFTLVSGSKHYCLIPAIMAGVNNLFEHGYTITWRAELATMDVVPCRNSARLEGIEEKVQTIKIYR